MDEGPKTEDSMTVHLVTFASDNYLRSANLCIESAKRHGVDGASIVMPTAPCSDRGYGFWKWKPEIIQNRMNLPEGNFLPVLKDGDILIYSDAGVEFINNVSHIIDRMDQDIFLFGNNWEHAHWCKRDVVEAIFSTETLPDYTHWTLPVDWGIFGKQCQASVIFFRVSDYSRQFVAEWLKWCLHRQRYSTICTDEWRYLIDDLPSIAPNHPEFREHRHDQAILTTLAYREGIKLHYWPAMYNDGAFSYEKLAEYAEDDYPILFHHHRRRNHEWSNAA